MPSTFASVAPGTVSPRRAVPASIPRPEYVDRPRPAPFTGPEVKDAETIAKMRVAGRIAANAMAAAAEVIAPGVTTDEIDRVGHEYLMDHHAYPSTLGYKGFPKSLCTSVNEVVCHGIPDDRRLEDGDIVNIDITAYVDGVHGDTDATYLCGEVDEESRLLVERTHEAMMRGIRAARAGRELNVIGRVIESYAKRFGYGVVRDFTGHGIGSAFHSGLIVPHYDAAPSYNTVIEPGMTFTVEPMLNLGTADWDMWEDGWTVVTKDRRRSAQFEHTLLVTEDGPEILTLGGRGMSTGHPLGIDVGGSGIKGAPVDLEAGAFAQKRLRIDTPAVSTPEAVCDVIAQVVDHFDEVRSDSPIGVTIPGVVQHGVVKTAANIDKAWIGCDIETLLEDRLQHDVVVVNDADAAGVGELTYGAAKGHEGLVILTTLGTGIGTAIFNEGVLVPNSELGHIEIDGSDAEPRTASSAKTREGLTYGQWAERLQKYYRALEDLMWPDLFVVGGGVSKDSEEFLPLLDIRTPIIPAVLKNKAGIIGAAVLATAAQRRRGTHTA